MGRYGSSLPYAFVGLISHHITFEERPIALSYGFDFEGRGNLIWVKRQARF